MTTTAFHVFDDLRRGAAPLLALALDAAAGLPSDAQAECVAVLELLRQLDCDDEVQAAAVWFAVAMHTPGAWQTARLALPEAVVRLVDGQRAAEQVWALHAEHGGGSEGLRRLLLAIIRDLRVVFVLLARQLARMRDADRLPAADALALARLTADIHAPLANRLGIWQLKWELEDLAFRYLQPDTYTRIAQLLDERRDARETFIARCIDELGAALAAAGIHADLAGRPKHILSIWKKMQRKDVEFDELYDIRAVRVLVDDIAACYAALGIVHSLWPHLPGEFDDYIARPKGNHYQSLHTAVFGPEGKALEVQIRTHAMHRGAELGVAAHWRYKEGGGVDAGFEKRVAWMRKLLEARGDDDAGLMADFRTELDEDRVYLLTPRGEVMDLARGATVLDFAYLVHTEVGHRCRGAKVNGRIVPLTFQPKSGDRVEILTAKVSDPSRDWLSPQRGFLNTPRAREKVRAWFRRSAHEDNIAAGRAILDRELRRLALADADPDGLLARLQLKSQDELLVALALGEVSPGQISRLLQEPKGGQSHFSETLQDGQRARAKNGSDPLSGALRVQGVGNLLNTLARCCQPLPGDAVRGFITRGRGVSVHRADCASLARLTRRDPDRVIDVEWGQVPVRAYEVDVVIRGYDRKGLHKDVTGVISAVGTPIVASASRVHTRSAEVDMQFTLRVRDFEQLSALLGKLEALPNVIEVRRLAAS